MCEFDPRCVGTEDLVATAYDRIDKGGWSAIGVLGDETGPPFAYTAGLTEHGRPELIITGLEPGQACRILNRAARLAVADRTFLDEPYLDDVVRPPYRLAVLPVVATGDMHVARLLFGPDFQALQLVWPDDAGNFPWDSGYTCPRDAQPLSGVPPLAA